MKAVLCLLGLAVLATAGLVSGTEEKAVCTEGSLWHNECNRCWCIEGQAACTKIKCRPSMPAPVPFCQDGSRWLQDNCNWCNCMNGVGVCTKRACLPAWASEVHAKEIGDAATVAAAAPAAADSATPAERECEAETEQSRWRQGCNWCRCTDTGVGVCTRRACSPNVDLLLRDVPECEGTVSWKDDCNNCHCTEGKAVCTKIACRPQEAAPAGETSVRAGAGSGGEGQQCEVEELGNRWRHQCNWCRCVKGRGACTKRGCPPSLAELLSSSPECEGTPRWKKDCNWCHCEEGRAVCTEIACLGMEDDKPVSETPVYEPDCVGSSSWTESCNTCNCNNGVKACTLIGCLKPVEDTCKEGAIWKKDCNWCSCREGVPVCSKKLCRSAEGGSSAGLAPAACLEGSSWYDGCNTCSCNNGHEICTRRACFTGVVSAPTPKEPEAPEVTLISIVPAVPDATQPQGESPAATPEPKVQPSFDIPEDDRDCVPGSRFSVDGCNMCTCSSTGRGMCTLKACFQQLEIVCEGNAQWKQGCNWCHCENGKAKCTELTCFQDLLDKPLVTAEEEEQQEELAPLPEDAECSEGARWKKDCNWCRCLNGLSVCEKRLCRPGEATEAEECEVGSQWRDSCNKCRCTSTGVGICTRRACLDGAAPAIATRTGVAEEKKKYPECRPGSKFRHACNQCTCSEEGYKLCTKKLCNPAEQQMTEPECEPNSLFLDEQNCNWCFCVRGRGACTRKFCERRETPAVRTQSAVAPIATRRASIAIVAADGDEPECEEGTQWMKDCNRCYCTNGHAVCHRRACLSAIRPLRTKVSATPTTGDSAPDKSRCYKPVDSGPCFASMRRFRFNSEHNRCEAFLFGGCGGNDNNFASPDDCQRTCGGESPVLDETCNRQRCPNYREIAYRQVRGCQPVYENFACCPTSFNCPELQEPGDETTCEYKGQTYELHADVPVEDPCSRCRCSSRTFDGRGVGLDCISVECPSLFVRPDPSCRLLYKLDQCCSYDKECSEPLLPVAPGSEPPPPPVVRTDQVECQAEGRTYLEGDVMYFDDDPCQKCICSADYTTPYGANCKRVDCGFDTRSQAKIKRGCVPIFFRASCCPITYWCPSDGHVMAEQSQAIPDGATGNVCVFGSLTVAQGSQLVTDDPKIKCQCTTPPSITCVQGDN